MVGVLNEDEDEMLEIAEGEGGNMMEESEDLDGEKGEGVFEAIEGRRVGCCLDAGPVRRFASAYEWLAEGPEGWEAA